MKLRYAFTLSSKHQIEMNGNTITIVVDSKDIPLADHNIMSDKDILGYEKDDIEVIPNETFMEFVKISGKVERIN